MRICAFLSEVDIDLMFEQETIQMSKMDEVRALREDPDVHYNCAQAVLIPFAEERGLDRKTAYALAESFGGGMRVGATCGALTGALMALGLNGGTTAQTQKLIRRFREMHDGLSDCAMLLKRDREKGNNDRKAHCDRMVYDAVEALEEVLSEG